ncbi:MAG: ABC transporter permease, partial [Planctomycetes bacterium]|nr:ABC transporter permease [Planctomycetota bacterium]
LFGRIDPVGQLIRIGAVPFEVVGVLASRGVSLDGGSDEDNTILVPIRTAMRRLFQVDHLDGIYLQVRGTELLPAAERQIATVLRRQHDLAWHRRPDDFEVEDQARALRAEMDASGSFTAMIAGTAGISLFVGGIGILAVMLITIRERVGEIGLRMAIGARPQDILIQFLSESVLLGACGGVLGLALGLGVASCVGECTEWTTYVAPTWMLAAVGASLVLGVGAGVYPAMRAARMDPIVALRAD